MHQLITEVRDMIKKQQIRKQPFVDMDGFKVYYEGIGSKNAK